MCQTVDKHDWVPDQCICEECQVEFRERQDKLSDAIEEARTTQTELRQTLNSILSTVLPIVNAAKDSVDVT